MLHPEERLATRPDLQQKLQSVMDIVGASCQTGMVAMMALQSQRIKFLLFNDAEMDAFSGGQTSAFFGRVDGQGYMGLRESVLNDRLNIFKLIKDVAHEAIHASQKDTLPSYDLAMNQRNNPQRTAAMVVLEKDAYSGTAEILLLLAHKEASNIAARTGQAIPLKDTSLMKDWLVQYPEEATLCMQAFERKAAHTGSIEEGIKAGRTAAIAHYQVHCQENDIRHFEERSATGSTPAQRAPRPR